MKPDKVIRRVGAAALEFDEQAEELFEPYADTLVVKALHPISKLGDQPALRTLSVALIAAGILARNHRLARAGSRMIIAHEGATFAKDMIKTEIDRTRPRSAERTEQRKPRKGKDTAKEKTSFPSGHSAGAIAAARAFSREYPAYAPVALGAATVIALLQIPRCAHYPTDVAAGIAIGLLGEKATDLSWNALGIGSLEEQ
jgi:membrane-associated phospholipid phosphatase